MKTGGYFVGNCISRSVGSGVWRIEGGFAFVSQDGRRIEIEDQFLTDFASVPRPLWSLIPSTDYLWDAPSAGHDKLVRSRKLLGLSLAQCHEYFLEMLLVRGQTTDPSQRSRNVVRAYAMYYAVWAFNWTMAGNGMGETPASLLKRVQVVDLKPAD